MPPEGDEFSGRMLGAINSMLVDMMAAIAQGRATPRTSGSGSRQARNVTTNGR